ncbi:hypothetical protein ES332_D08G087200v1 [Gossypium tomentosum]|uniref:Uncharacterized protein n=1 Tax=Gossypium tomentosum TaxID=34277 RepID=A0A5D2JRL7_GOSTO|nr:hypothetical protein ES332_D08G087200v1 [Gossypium tomentosum]
MHPTQQPKVQVHQSSSCGHSISQCYSKQILGDFRRQAPNMSFEFAMLPFLDEHTITGLTANKTTISICNKKLKMLTESINHPGPCFTHKSKPTNLRLLLQFKTTMRLKKYASATSTVDSPFH